MGLAIGIVIAVYGLSVLWNREIVIPFGHKGFFNPEPMGYFHLYGITAAIIGLSLLIDGIVIGFLSGCQLVFGHPLFDQLDLWLPVIGLVIIVIGIIGAALSAVLRNAKSAGDQIYARNHAQHDQENKEQPL